LEEFSRKKGDDMKNVGFVTRGGNAVKYGLMIAVPFLLSGCYTVLKQSSEYYSEFDQKSVPRDTTSRNVADEMTALKDNAADHDSIKDEEADDQTTVVNNYYGSAWGGYPYSRWGMSFGYGYSPYYSGWYDWGYYPSSDYWYWGGCYYPTGFGGYYRPYYPYYNFTPVSPYAHRNYGGRHYATQAGGIGLIGHSYGGNLVHNNSGGTQRTYKTGTASTSTRTDKAAATKGRRHYRSGDHASGPTKKVRSGSSGGRTYGNNKSVTRAFENASRNQSGRSFTNSSTRSSSGSSRGSNQSAPRSGGGGGRSFKK
jgi:hypothetical protein